MPGKLVLLLLIPGWFLQPLLQAQDPEGLGSRYPSDLEFQAERMLENDGSSGIPEELFLQRESLAMDPIDLNLAQMEELLSSGLFSPFQAGMILRHREKYGTILSLNELLKLPGFNSAFLRQIRPFICLDGKAIKPSQAHTGAGITLGAQRSWPRGDETWPGSGWKYKVAVGIHAGKGWMAKLAYEKDPGEKAFMQKKPENLNGFLSWSGKGFVKEAVAGTYRVQNGLGLLYGSGMFHSPDAYMKQATRLSALHPYAGVAESSLLKGLAVRAGTGKLSMMGHMSFQHMDLSLTGYDPEQPPADWSGLIRNGGLHRTASEIAGRGLGNLGNTGLQLILNHRGLFAGTHFSLQYCGPSRAGKDSLGADLSPVLNYASGIHWQWYRDRLGSSGEILYRTNSSLSALGIFSCNFSDYLSALLIINSYGPGGSLPFKSAYHTGSGPEQGFAFHLNMEPYRSLQTEFCIQYFRHFPGESTRSFPEQGYRFRALFRLTVSEELDCRLGLQVKAMEEDGPVNGSGCAPLRTDRQKRLDLQIVYGPDMILEWKNRFILSSFREGSSPDPDLSFAASSQLNIRPTRYWRIKSWFCLFHVPLWQNRIYLWEPGLYHEFGFRALNGNGQRFALISELKVAGKITIESKISCNGFPGTDLKPADLTAGMQLRIRL